MRKKLPKDKTLINLKESDIQKTILEWLQWQGVFCWRNNSGKFFIKDRFGKTRAFSAGIRGASDIMGILKGGIFLAIEVKKPKGKLTEDQEHFLNKIRKNNGIAFVASSIEDVENELSPYFL